MSNKDLALYIESVYNPTPELDSAKIAREYESDAFAQGKTYYEHHAAYEPYPTGSVAAAEWRAGWEAAAKADAESEPTAIPSHDEGPTFADRQSAALVAEYRKPLPMNDEED